MRTSGLFIFFLLTLWIFGCSPARTVTRDQEKDASFQLKVYNDSVLMDNFLGVNAVYHGFAFMPDVIEKGMNDQDREREFSRVRNMDLKLARTWYHPEYACGDNIYNEFNWESDKMKAFYRWLDKMKELNVDIVLQSGWSFPANVNHHASQNRTNDTIKPNPDKDPERYATWVNESLYQMIKVRGYTNVKYLILFTEPFNNNKSLIPDGYTRQEYYKNVCYKIHEHLLKSGLREDIKIVGPNSGSTDTAAWIGWSVRNMDKVIDIYSWHTYNGFKYSTNPPKEYKGWKEIVEVGKQKVRQTNKPFWMDEYGANRPNETIRFKPDYGNYLAQAVAAFTNSGVQTSLLWILFDQQYHFNTTNSDSFYNGIQRWGLTKYPHDNLPDNENPYPSWYAFSMMSKFLGGRNNTKVYKTVDADSIYIVATKPTDKDFSVMVVNGSHSAKKINVNFQKKIDQSTLSRHLYDPSTIKVSREATIIGSDKKLKISKQSFTDDLPSRAVAIYTSIE